MPYYLFKVSQGDRIGLVKNLDLIDEFEAFKSAKSSAKSRRQQSTADSGFTYKIIFADNQLMAEEQLMEKREKPTLMEHEI